MRHEEIGPSFQAKLDEAADWLIREFVRQNAIQSKLLARGHENNLQREGSRSGKATLRGSCRAVPAGGRGLSRLTIGQDAVVGRQQEYRVQVKHLVKARLTQRKRSILW